MQALRHEIQEKSYKLVGTVAMIPIFSPFLTAALAIGSSILNTGIFKIDLAIIEASFTVVQVTITTSAPVFSAHIAYCIILRITLAVAFPAANDSLSNESSHMFIISTPTPSLLFSFLILYS